MPRPFLFALISLCGFAMQSAHANDLQYIGSHSDRGASDAVLVDDATLVHTAQLTALDRQGTLLGKENVQAEIEHVFANLSATLAIAKSNLDQIVKLNVYITAPELRTAVEAALAKSFSSNRKPAVSYVVTRLPIADARIALDAVAVSGDPIPRVKLAPVEQLPSSKAAHLSITPPGSRIYVAGQAEKGANLGEATRLTLESLRKTLESLGRGDEDVVQLKAFLSPMDDVKTVMAAMNDFFGKRDRLPPLVFVEWTAPLIEIELIAWGGNQLEAPAVEFITPPGMTASPVYSRVARINRTRSIYTSGLFAADAGDAAAETRAIFEQLEQVLGQSKSDFKHLAKATYYCSTNAASQKLNELRPNYYDPKRPPSASKAMVRGVGKNDCELTLDMIAVPSGK